MAITEVKKKGYRGLPFPLFPLINKMKHKQIFTCEKCRIPLTKDLIRVLEDHIFCYYCSRRQIRLNTKMEGKQNEEKNSEN